MQLLQTILIFTKFKHLGHIQTVSIIIRNYYKWETINFQIVYTVMKESQK
jgi:hypothetical protein